MTMLLVERNYGTAPHPLNWYVQRISLDSYSAKFGVLLVCEGILYTLISSQKIQVSFMFLLSRFREESPSFISDIRLSKCATTAPY